MRKILFVCHGNICRSAMAESIMKNLIHESRRENEFFIDSAALSAEEIGNPMDYRARRVLESHGIEPGNHRSRQMSRQDLEDFDEIYLMDQENVRMLSRRFHGCSSSRIHMLGPQKDIEDPWWTGRFDKVYEQIERAVNGLMNKKR